MKLAEMADHPEDLYLRSCRHHTARPTSVPVQASLSETILSVEEEHASDMLDLLATHGATKM